MSILLLYEQSYYYTHVRTNTHTHAHIHNTFLIWFLHIGENIHIYLFEHGLFHLTL
jgi:hypothetical protein